MRQTILACSRSTNGILNIDLVEFRNIWMTCLKTYQKLRQNYINWNGPSIRTVFIFYARVLGSTVWFDSWLSIACPLELPAQFNCWGMWCICVFAEHVCLGLTTFCFTQQKLGSLRMYRCVPGGSKSKGESCWLIWWKEDRSKADLLGESRFYRRISFKISMNHKANHCEKSVWGVPKVHVCNFQSLFWEFR